MDIDTKWVKKFMNKTYVSMYIEPFVGEYDIDGIRRNLNFTWIVTQISQRMMTISLQFEKPLDISMNFVYDHIVMIIKSRTEIIETLEELRNTKYLDTSRPREPVLDSIPAQIFKSIDGKSFSNFESRW